MREKVKDDTKMRILNTHYYMPPDAMTVELMTDGYTDPEVISFLVARQKMPARDPTSPGGNQDRTYLQSSLGSSEERGFDHPRRGRLRSVRDRRTVEVGLDTVAFIEEHYIKERGLSLEKTVDYLKKGFLDGGKLGMKSPNSGLCSRIYTLLAVDLGLARN
ncbi:hypothetical protein QBC33DRAFT_255177 [Phialemonium atrogriseum]|uniref:Uncharacterized protein n=1 Tax=Phialemonium atrogriseum TaxID=1093897 RepID=A0AAJ0BTI1_9PEZI|nr:uncharacterized protein QBC33DRAFT_255177 [Phialemonium atrogriseum]KAK1762772.1 hypothetical protein QBC33DRAFT_255177 [Phialemonium atrogriseum]